MTVKNGDMPAMPVFPDTETGHAAAFRGLTKREQFAMAAMQGFCTDGNMNTDNIPVVAVRVADELLAELERTK